MNDVPENRRREIEEILKEIAADPNAKLLRIPPIESLLALACQPKVGVHAASLTSAERYLLATYREELAFLLRERCVIEFYAEPDAHTKWHRSLTVDRDYEVPEVGDWRRRARATVAKARGEEVLGEGADALERCVELTPGAGSEIAQIAASSLRLVPADQAKVYLALCSMNEGRHEDGRRACIRVLEQRPSAAMAASCWENVGYSLGHEARYHEAAHAYRSATEQVGIRPSLVVFWFANALAAGDERGLREAASALDGLSPSSITCWDIVEMQAARFVAARGGVDADLSNTGPAARRILDAFRS
jgi:hypothetical protein